MVMQKLLRVLFSLAYRKMALDSECGSDGANIMVGCRSGVVTRQKKHNPLMLAIHCINHRLALGAAQSIESVLYLKKFSEVLVGTLKLYHYSSVRQASLKEIQCIYEDPILTFKEPKSI